MLANTVARRNRLNSHPPVGVGRVVLHSRQRGDILVAWREIDFGGCRCQAFALTGDARATDPVCHLAPRHEDVAALAAVQHDASYAYRRM